MLAGLAKRFIKVGRLRITYPDGRTDDYGDGAGPQIAARPRLHPRRRSKLSAPAADR